jgi:hypothetical protein
MKQRSSPLMMFDVTIIPVMDANATSQGLLPCEAFVVLLSGFEDSEPWPDMTIRSNSSLPMIKRG